MDLLRSILDQSGYLVVVLDCETARVADCNDAQCRAAGRTRDELVGKPVSEVHVSFPLQTREQWDYFVGRVAAEPGMSVDTQFRRSDGSFYPVRIECTLYENEGRKYVLVVGRQTSIGPTLQSQHEREIRWQNALYLMASHPAITAGRFTEAAEFITATGCRVFPADKCTIWRIEDGRVYFLADDRGSLQATRAEPVELARFPWLAAAVVSGRCTDLYESCRTPDEREHTKALAAAYDAKAVLCAPIRAAGRSWGAVTVASRTDREWRPDEIGFAAEIADQVANAVASDERRRAEEELRASQERYRGFLEMSAEAVWRIEFPAPVPLDLPLDEQVSLIISTGYVADCNDAFARFFNQKDRDTFVGARLEQLLAPIGPARLREFRQMAEAGYRIVNLGAHHLVGGQDRWVLRNVNGVFEDGCLVQLWGASRDITERKRAEDLLMQSEQRYRAFVANSSEGIFRVEYPQPIPLDLPLDEIVQRSWDTGILAECNQALARMRGYERPDQLVGRLSIELRLQTAEEWQQDLEFLRNGCRIADLERPTRRQDGTLRWFNYSTVGVVENGCLTRVWGRVADVTERHALEDELRALSARRASTLEQERARIAREIHDELGQQLTALKFEAAALERGSRLLVKGELTRGIDEAIQTVRRIASDLRPAILDHFGLVAAMEWMANDVSRRTGIECDCDLAAGLEVEPALSTTVFRIFQEALTNAVRHSGATQVRVHVRALPDRLELTVADNGCGVDHAPGAPPSLGLIGMRERAKEAGGAVTVAGSPGEGTCVEAWFPLGETAAKPGAPE